MRIELNAYEQDREQIWSLYEQGSQGWEPLQVITKRKGNKSDLIDFIMGVPVLTGKAKEILTPLIGNDVDFLPLIHNEHELFVLKVNRVQDFIDMTNPVERKIGYGYLSDFVHVYPEKIDPRVHIFRLPQHLNTRIYVSDDFKNAVEAQKLKTFQFIKIWDTENTEEERKGRLKQFDAFYKGIATREKVSFQEAMELVKKGNIVRSSNNIMKNENGVLLLGEIFDNETIQWIKPLYIPPLYFERQWLVYESSESERVIQEYFAELSYEINGPNGNVVYFDDKNLEVMVRAQLQVYKEDLTDINLLKLRKIIPKYDDGIVASLSGIEHAKNLLEFMVSGNTEFDVKELKHLPGSLCALAVNKSGLTNISIITELNFPKLSSVSFSDNNLVDLSPLAFIPSLTRIDVQNNQIENILPLNQIFDLNCVILDHNPVKNIHELQLPNLQTLFIAGIKAEDWGFLLTGFPKLKYVSISDQGMSEVSKKSMREIIRSKKFTVAWIKSDGLAKLYNYSNRER